MDIVKVQKIYIIAIDLNSVFDTNLREKLIVRNQYLIKMNYEWLSFF